MSESFHVKFSFSGFIVLQNKTFKWPNPFLTFLWLSPFKEGLALYLNSLHQRIICTKFDWFWPAGSGEEDFLKKISVFLLFRYYLPLERGYPLLLNKFKFPLPKDALCQVWLKLAKLFWRRFLNDPNRFLHFFLLSPLWKGPDPLFEQTWITFTQG